MSEVLYPCTDGVVFYDSQFGLVFKFVFVYWCVRITATFVLRTTCVELDRYDENLKYTAIYTVFTKCSLF